MTAEAETFPASERSRAASQLRTERLKIVSAERIPQATAVRALGGRDLDFQGICLVEYIFREPSQGIQTALKRSEHRLATDAWEDTLV